MQTIDTNKHSLTILEAFPEDEGIYKCVVTNPAGYTSSSAFLKIEQNALMPSFVKTMNDYETDENLPAEFNVEVKGDPLPNVEWSHNGTVVKQGVNFTVTYSQLLITNKISFFQNFLILIFN